MTKTYEELAAIDDAEVERDRVRVLYALGLLTPNMSGLEVLLLHAKICDETWKQRSAAQPMLEPLDVLAAMSKKERAELRARVLR